MSRYRKITANYIFPVSGLPVKNGLLILDKDGIVIDLIDRQGDEGEIEGLEYYNGIICPGFVNAHCHLELSHLKGKIQSTTNLSDFLYQIFLKRDSDIDLVLKAARQADLFMLKNGIVAVGDIVNSSHALEVKEKSKLYYHSFIEVFGFSPQRALRAMEYAEFVSRLFHTSKLVYSVTPHSPYSTSSELFDLIRENNIGNKLIFSLHHQESMEEDKMFENKTGELIKHYQNNMKMNISDWMPTGFNSTQSVIPKLEKDIPLLLVHNIYMNSTHCQWLKQNRSVGNTFLVTCPKSNLYIENCLPDYQLLKSTGFRICVGTDSLASNNSLSVIEELKVIQYSNALSLNELFEWSCLNGASALGIDDWAGSFETGKKPGVNLITGIDFKTMKLTEGSKVKKLA